MHRLRNDDRARLPAKTSGDPVPVDLAACIGVLDESRAVNATAIAGWCGAGWDHSRVSASESLVAVMIRFLLLSAPQRRNTWSASRFEIRITASVKLRPRAASASPPCRPEPSARVQQDLTATSSSGECLVEQSRRAVPGDITTTLASNAHFGGEVGRS